MPRRDFILRLIEQMGRVLAAIRARVLGGETTAVRGELRQVMEWSGIDLDLAERVDAPTLVALLSLGGTLDPARCVLVADVLGVDALREEALGETETATRLRAKALVLYREARPLLSGGDADALEQRMAILAADDAARLR